MEGTNNITTGETQQVEHGITTEKTGVNYADIKESIDTTKLLSNYENATISENGDIVDKDGNIIKKFDEYKDNLDEFKVHKEKEQEEIKKVKIDDNLYTIDANGNAVDDNGNIVIKSEELENLLKDAKEIVKDDKSIDVNYLQEQTGLVVLDENGNPKEFDNTIEGLKAREIALVNQIKQQAVKEYEEQFYANNPDIASLIEYKKTFGTLEGYNEFVDYENVILGDNEEQLMAVIIQAEKNRGKDDSLIEEYVNFIKDKKMLKQVAERDLEYLKNITKERKAMLIKKQEEERLKVEERVNKFNNEVRNFIQQGKIDNIVLPENIKVNAPDGSIKYMSKEQLIEYITKPVAEVNGFKYTQYYLDYNDAFRNKSEDEVLRENAKKYINDAIYFLTKRDLSQIIKETVNKKRVEKIYEIKKNSTTSSKVDSNTSVSGIGNISLK